MRRFVLDAADGAAAVAAVSMFHVKPSPPKKTSFAVPVSPAANQISSRVRILVEESLHALDFFPPEPRFLERIERFAEALALWGSRINLTARPENPSEIAFHIIDSLMPLDIAIRPEGRPLHNLFTSGCRVLDLGSGAGFPGLILAAGCDAEFTLLETRRRRASFLSAAITTMSLRNATVDARRIEPPALEPVYDAVTARAFAEPRVVYESAAAALKPAGTAILYASPSQKLQSGEAAAFGLAGPVEIAYEVARERKRMPRILAIWRKS